VRNYELIFSKFDEQFGERDVGSITQETVLAFLTDFTERNKQSTKRLRYSLLSAFFNFIKNSFDPAFQNPCVTPILRKIFKEPKSFPWDILEKDVVDEIIFRTVNPRNRIMRIVTLKLGY
jgi:integrase